MTARVGGLTLRSMDREGGAFGAAGDRSAAASVAAELEINHGQALFGFVRRQGLSDEQAADAVQEVLARLLDEMAHGTQILNPRAWAYRAIFRLAMDEHRLRRRVLGLVDLLARRHNDIAQGPEENDRITVWTEVDRLPLRQRQVLYLRYRSDLSFDEIGGVLGITASAARSHSTQALATIRARLRDLGEP